jgi:hypothetical protein
MMLSAPLIKLPSMRLKTRENDVGPPPPPRPPPPPLLRKGFFSLRTASTFAMLSGAVYIHLLTSAG